MIPGTCPDCGAIRPLADYLRDADARAALVAALDCPSPLARRIVPYLALHSPAGRAIQSARLTRLLRELADLLMSGDVTRRTVTHPAPLPIWEAALDEVLGAHAAGRLTLPLDGHGYLLEIAWRLAARPGPAARGPVTPGHQSHQPADPEHLRPRAPARPPAVAPRGAPRALGAILAALTPPPTPEAPDD